MDYYPWADNRSSRSLRKGVPVTVRSIFLVLLLAVGLAGCEEGRYADPRDAEQITLDDGQAAWQIQCRRTVFECYTSARRVCPQGYRTVSNESVTFGQGYSSSAQGGVLSRGSWITLHVICENPAS